MADRVVQMTTEYPLDHYLWDNGWVVSFNRETKAWTKLRIPTANELLIVEALVSRELAPGVCDD